MFSHDELIGMVWDFSETPYQKRCRQLKEYIQSKLDVENLTVSRSHIGNRSFYNIKVNNTTSCHLDKLFKGVSSGLVHFASNDGKYIVYLVDEEELHDKYLKNGDLVFKEPFNFITAFYKGHECKIKEQSDGILSVFCDTVANLCLIHIKDCASPTDVLSDLKIENNAKYWSHFRGVIVINMDYIDLEEGHGY